MRSHTLPQHVSSSTFLVRQVHLFFQFVNPLLKSIFPSVLSFRCCCSRDTAGSVGAFLRQGSTMVQTPVSPADAGAGRWTGLAVVSLTHAPRPEWPLWVTSHQLRCCKIPRARVKGRLDLISTSSLSEELCATATLALSLLFYCSFKKLPQCMAYDDANLLSYSTGECKSELGLKMWARLRSRVLGHSLFSYFLKFTETALIPWQSPQNVQFWLSTWLDQESTKMQPSGHCCERLFFFFFQ